MARESAPSSCLWPARRAGHRVPTRPLSARRSVDQRSRVEVEQDEAAILRGIQSVEVGARVVIERDTRDRFAGLVQTLDEQPPLVVREVDRSGRSGWLLEGARELPVEAPFLKRVRLAGPIGRVRLGHEVEAAPLESEVPAGDDVGQGVPRHERRHRGIARIDADERGATATTPALPGRDFVVRLLVEEEEQLMVRGIFPHPVTPPDGPRVEVLIALDVPDVRRELRERAPRAGVAVDGHELLPAVEPDVGSGAVGRPRRTTQPRPGAIRILVDATRL
jgi:hypothetical protein